MKSSSHARLILGYLAAVLVATVWGSIVQTQFNISALNTIGADIGAGVRMQATLTDIFSGFTPTYGGYVVAPSLLVAFFAASFIAGEQPRAQSFWFALAGGVAILLGIPLVNYLSPVALLVGASRDWICTLLMALGGVVAGLLFVRIALRARIETTTHDGVTRRAVAS